ncbi:MAG: hypothetical protein A2289_13610 [Deltaproteobacteria bacterium RIFOXYA12_FULL_58_15]|nr:MAG: hypothetical protein A2289_13610 [Deltaproteobacteria bacterium RIFOXYA12_FULL_58_15]
MRTLTVSVAVVILAAACSGGDGSSACSAISCEGCCEADLCRVGDDDIACGQGGAACADCTTGVGLCLQRACHEPCGNDTIEAGEQCDGDDLGSETCITLGSAGGTLACANDCQFDLSACTALTCVIAASDPEAYPCQFCSAGGGAIVYCGFCHPYTPPDETDPCEAGTQCYTWFDPDLDNTTVACLDAPPETCNADFEDECDGDVVVVCRGGRVIRNDCAEAGDRCTTVTWMDGSFVPGCVELEADPCTLGGYDESCDNGVPVICDPLTSYESHRPCEEGLCVDFGAEIECLPEGWVECDPETFEARCEDDAIITCAPVPHSSGTGMEVADPCDASKICAMAAAGITCMQTGTVACDSSAYVPHCDGGRLFRCSPVLAWEYFDDCSVLGEGLLTCQEFAEGPSCAPPDYTPCEDTGSTCVADNVQECRHPGWVAEIPCASPSPVCLEADDVAVCTFAGAASCTPQFGPGILCGSDRYGTSSCHQALRCDGSSTVVLCHASAAVEVTVTCPFNDCVEDPVWADDYEAYCDLLR